MIDIKIIMTILKADKEHVNSFIARISFKLGNEKEKRETGNT